jgi:hypothetical protein
MNIDHEVVEFTFTVCKHTEIRRIIIDTLAEFVGPSFVVDDWVFEVTVEHNGYRGVPPVKIWSVSVTAGYTG